MDVGVKSSSTLLLCCSFIPVGSAIESGEEAVMNTGCTSLGLGYFSILQKILCLVCDCRASIDLVIWYTGLEDAQTTGK